DGYDTAIQDSLRREDIKVVVEDGPDMKIRLAEITAAVNPLLAAASPLLCALAQMPRELSPGFVEHYRALLEREVRRYQTLCDQANLRR
ncbi:DotU family type IV/VI secretion system protein, partial [Escherichia coli]|nr:DotU family type IV/VI secretion system protein [Escherichia coli]